MNVQDVLEWDEHHDPAQTPVRVTPWRMLGTYDRQLLDVLADGTWLHEDSLRRLLRWGRFRFFVITTKMVMFGWIEAKKTDSILRSAYRLNPAAWT